MVEDENGNVVRELMRDNDVIAQYKTMRETLVYLCHLDTQNTEDQMLEKLRRQLNGAEWAWSRLNTLCWAIGSISGSMNEDQVRPCSRSAPRICMPVHVPPCRRAGAVVVHLDLADAYTIIHAFVWWARRGCWTRAAT